MAAEGLKVFFLLGWGSGHLALVCVVSFFLSRLLLFSFLVVLIFSLYFLLSRHVFVQ